MGDDLTPAAAARISFDGQPRGWDGGDGKLTRYLLTNDHLSPFEMVEVMFEVKAPIFVARQWVRHRTANWNEFSMRYAEPGRIGEYGDIEFYTPAQFAQQSGVNKQSSDQPLSPDDNVDAHAVYARANREAERAYELLIDMGVSREQARAVLPVNTYTKWVWKNDLRNTMHFMGLRQGHGAQAEIRDYADAMETLLRTRLPNLVDLWKETQ